MDDETMQVDEPEGLPEDNPIVRAIKVSVDKAVEDARKHDEENARKLAKTAKNLKRVIAVLVVVVICLAITTGLVVNRQVTHPTTNAIQRNQIAACQQANVRLKADIGIWQSYIALGNKQTMDTAAQLGQLISVLADNDPAKIATIKSILVSSSKVNTADQQQFLELVAGVDAAKDCVAAYNISSSNPASIQSVFSTAGTMVVPVARG